MKRIGQGGRSIPTSPSSGARPPHSPSASSSSFSPSTSSVAGESSSVLKNLFGTHHSPKPDDVRSGCGLCCTHHQHHLHRSRPSPVPNHLLSPSCLQAPLYKNSLRLKRNPAIYKAAQAERLHRRTNTPDPTLIVRKPYTDSISHPLGEAVRGQPVPFRRRLTRAFVPPVDWKRRSTAFFESFSAPAPSSSSRTPPPSKAHREHEKDSYPRTPPWHRSKAVKGTDISVHSFSVYSVDEPDWRTDARKPSRCAPWSEPGTGSVPPLPQPLSLPLPVSAHVRS